MNTRLFSFVLLVTFCCVFSVHAQIGGLQSAKPQTSALGPELTVIMEVYGEYKEFFGHHALALGDINNDGWPDFGVGGYKSGNFKIYLGGLGILDSVPDLVLKGGKNAVLADMNHDGIKDLIAVKHRTFFDTAFFYLGRKDEPLRYSAQPDFYFPADGNFGYSMDAGDFNGDGFEDVAIADHSGWSGQGVVFIFMGKVIPDAKPEFILSKTEQYYSQFGYRLQIGDINGDGYDDLAVGRDHQQYGIPPNDFTMKIFYFGNSSFIPIFDQPDQYIDSKQVVGSLYDGFLEDVNNDGYTDFIFSDEGSNGTVRCGSAAGLSSSVDRIIPRPGGMIWHGIRRLDHDITGDGYRDYVVHVLSVGDAYVSFLRGSNGWLTGPFASQWPWFTLEDYGDPNCRRVCSLGDVNGDRRNDVLVCGPSTPGERGFCHILSGIGSPISTVQDDVFPTRMGIAAVRPNPSSGPVIFDLTTPSLAQVRVSVHNALGQELYLITEAAYTPGTHTLLWNGHDASGSRVPSGVYLLRATSTSSTVTQRIVMQ